MKKFLFALSILSCLTACNKTDDKNNPGPGPEKSKAKLVLEWEQSDNIKPYTNPQVAYCINGGEVKIEAPSNKTIEFSEESGKVEIAFFSGETAKDINNLITEAKNGETVSYNYFAAINGTGVAFNTSPIKGALLKDSDGNVAPPFDVQDELRTAIFDEFNCGSKNAIRRYKHATGKERKLVITWETNGDRIDIKHSYENGNLFQ